MASAEVSYDSKSQEGTVTMTVGFSLWSIGFYLLTLISSVATVVAADYNVIVSMVFVILAYWANFNFFKLSRSELAKTSYEKASMVVSFDSASQQRKIVISAPLALRFIAICFLVVTTAECTFLTYERQDLVYFGLLFVETWSMMTLLCLCYFISDQGKSTSSFLHQLTGFTRHEGVKCDESDKSDDLGSVDEKQVSNKSKASMSEKPKEGREKHSQKQRVEVEAVKDENFECGHRAQMGSGEWEEVKSPTNASKTTVCGRYRRGVNGAHVGRIRGGQPRTMVGQMERSKWRRERSDLG